VEQPAVEEWIRAIVTPVGPIEVTHARSWATVARVPLSDGVAWFKACAEVQAFEPRLTGELFARWPDRVPVVLGRDDARGWLLLADAGTPMRELGNPPEMWLRALQLCAELQRGETAFALDHLKHGVPDLRLATWPARYAALLQRELPLEEHEIAQLRDFAPRFAELCAELMALGPGDSIQHDDLHLANVYLDGAHLRLLDWGDSSISHPFALLVVTFRFLEEVNGLQPGDAWYARLRDAYLEPWGPGLSEAFALALRTGAFAHCIAWMRQRDALPPPARREFNEVYAIVLRRAIREIARV
jgi:hypothetical protein